MNLHLQEWVYPVGSNADVDTAAAEDVWVGGGAYTWPAAAAATTLVSGSADDAAAGTGARSIEVTGLLAGGVLARETVVPVGVTPVALANSYLRILDARVKSAGSGAVNAGAITIATGGTTSGVMPAGAGRLNAALYTVPADRTAYLAGWTLNTGSVTAGYLTGSLLVRPSGQGWQTLDLCDLTTPAPARMDRQFPGMIYLPALTDVRIQVAASANNMVAIGSLALMLGAAF